MIWVVVCRLAARCAFSPDDPTTRVLRIRPSCRFSFGALEHCKLSALVRFRPPAWRSSPTVEQCRTQRSRSLSVRKTLDTAVAFRLPDECRRRRHIEKRDRGVEVATEITLLWSWRGARPCAAGTANAQKSSQPARGRRTTTSRRRQRVGQFLRHASDGPDPHQAGWRVGNERWCARPELNWRPPA